MQLMAIGAVLAIRRGSEQAIIYNAQKFNFIIMKMNQQKLAFGIIQIYFKIEFFLYMHSEYKYITQTFNIRTKYI